MDEATRKCNRRYYLADRGRFLADGGGCEMPRLDELLCRECGKLPTYQHIGRPSRTDQ